MRAKHRGSAFLGLDQEGDIFPDEFAQVATVESWGGDLGSVVNGAIVEIVDKGYGYFTAVPVEPIAGWGRDEIACLKSELVPLNTFTEELLDAIEDLEA